MKNKNDLDLTQAIELLGEAMRVLGPAHFSLREDIGWLVDEARGLLSGEAELKSGGDCEDYSETDDYEELCDC